MESPLEIPSDSKKSATKTSEKTNSNSVTVSVPVCLTMLVDVEVSDVDVETKDEKLHGVNLAECDVDTLGKIVRTVAGDPMIEKVINELIKTALKVRFDRVGTRVFITSFAGVSEETEI